MECVRCKATIEPGSRLCFICGALADGERSLSWDDPKLAVASDPPLRRTYRSLQSWYREHVLGADYGSTMGKIKRPVGSLLAPEAVANDRALNFFDDRSILAYVDHRVLEVQAASGTLDEHRLHHNMLSSMPMAFSFVAALRHAEDRALIVSKLFGVDCFEVVEVFAEWTPGRPSAELLNDRTAFDAAILYRSSTGATGLIGIETKYTEPLSQRKYLKDRYVQVTSECGWFRPNAETALVASTTNQLWRNAMLAAVSERLVVDDARVAVIGLGQDVGLWRSADALTAQMAKPDRILPRTWESVIESLRTSSIASFAALFNERYLDTGPLYRSPEGPRLRRSTVGAEEQRRWAFVDAPEWSRSSSETNDVVDRWAVLFPTVWRALSDPARTLAIPPAPPNDFDRTLGWWSPLIDLLVYALGWQSPARGLTRWMGAGRSLADSRLSLVEAVWGRHLDAVSEFLWRGHEHFEQDMAERLGLSTQQRPDPPPGLPQLTEASTAVHNPATGGSDPLHLTMHYSKPLERSPAGKATMNLGTSSSGPNRAVLHCASYMGWYRELHELGTELPARGETHGWRVDVMVDGIGYLGTYRRSSQTHRWFAGDHEAHLLGAL